MAAIVQLYQPITATVFEDGATRQASDEELRRLYPDAPKEVVRYEAAFPEEIRDLCALVPCDDKTLEDVLWDVDDGKSTALYLPYWTTALLYVRTHREELRADESFGQRGNYDTLLYALYRLCWEATMSMITKVRKR